MNSGRVVRVVPDVVLLRERPRLPGNSAVRRVDHLHRSGGRSPRVFLQVHLRPLEAVRAGIGSAHRFHPLDPRLALGLGVALDWRAPPARCTCPECRAARPAVFEELCERVDFSCASGAGINDAALSAHPAVRIIVAKRRRIPSLLSGVVIVPAVSAARAAPRATACGVPGTRGTRSRAPARFPRGAGRAASGSSTAA